MLKETENNYIASVYFDEEDSELSVCYSDISTGELYLTEYHGSDVYQTLLNELVKIKASEIILSEELSSAIDMDELKLLTDAYFDIMPQTTYNEKSMKDMILAQFGTISLTSIGLDGNGADVMALGALLSYLFETQKQDLRALTHINHYEIGSHMTLDKSRLKRHPFSL